jgi:hypothetical protein
MMCNSAKSNLFSAVAIMALLCLAVTVNVQGKVIRGSCGMEETSDSEYYVFSGAGNRIRINAATAQKNSMVEYSFGGHRDRTYNSPAWNTFKTKRRDEQCSLIVSCPRDDSDVAVYSRKNTKKKVSLTLSGQSLGDIDYSSGGGQYLCNNGPTARAAKKKNTTTVKKDPTADRKKQTSRTRHLAQLVYGNTKLPYEQWVKEQNAKSDK